MPNFCSRPAYGLIAILLTVLPALAQAQAMPESVPQPSAPDLDPETPMAPMPDIGVAWPTLERDATEAETEKSSIVADAEQRYTVRIEGIAEKDLIEIEQRFDELSALKAGESKPVNVAQLNRRASEDGDLLNSLLRSRGFYDADIETRVEQEIPGRLIVRLIAEVGPLYRFGDVDVKGLASLGDKAKEARDIFAVETKDAVDAVDVMTGKAELETELRRKGHPFATVSEPEIVVDHDTRSATLSMKVDPGSERRYGSFIVKGSKPPFGAKHVATIARFKPGQLYDEVDLEDLRRALIATSLVSVAEVKPVEGKDSGTADIAVTLEPAPYHTIAASAGYDTGEGVRAELSWTHRNFIEPEGALTLHGIAGTREQLGGAALRMSNFKRRDQVLNARIAVRHVNLSAYDARTFEVAAGIERQSNIIWQKKWTWSAGFELLTSDERDAALSTRATYFIGAVPLMLQYDGSDNLLDPTRGFRLSGRLSPELSLQAGTFGYAKAQIDASAYLPAGKSVTLAGRIRVGTIAGAPRSRVAPSRRFYAGGGGSVRGYAYQLIGPRDANNDPIGGKSLAEFALEARVRTPLLDHSISFVPFIDGGAVSDTKIADFKQFRFGAGLGVRYHSSFGPIRVDVGTPLNPQKGDPRVTVYVSLGQAF
jgi:translocation and assembly module TamA